MYTVSKYIHIQYIYIHIHIHIHTDTHTHRHTDTQTHRHTLFKVHYGLREWDHEKTSNVRRQLSRSRWYYFDDSTVRRCSEEDVASDKVRIISVSLVLSQPLAGFILSWVISTYFNMKSFFSMVLRLSSTFRWVHMCFSTSDVTTGQRSLAVLRETEFCRFFSWAFS